jgi:hypothetical protein
VKSTHHSPDLIYRSKITRVESAIEMKTPSDQSHIAVGDISILRANEPWFHFRINQEHSWALEGAEIPTQPKQMISNPKRMLTIF